MELYVFLGAAAAVLMAFIIWDIRRLRRVRQRSSALDDMDMPRPGYGGDARTHFSHDNFMGSDGGGGSGGGGGGSG